MKTETAAAVLRELDVCRSLFDSLAYQLENNATIGDYWPLAVLAGEGKRKIDGIVDEIDRAGMAA